MAGPPSAVQWLWYDDANWKPYNSDTAGKLEAGFLRGIKEIKVDDQRFVQVSTNDEIKKNFLKLPPDWRSCIGMQRRYDDESKRRLVKRFVPQFLENDVFYFGGAWKAVDKDEVSEEIGTYGGVMSGPLNNKVTLILINPNDFAGFENVKGKAREWGIPIVTKDFVYECIKQSKRLDSGPFVIVVKPPAPPPPPVEAAAPVAPPVAPAAPAADEKAPKKRKRRGDSSSSEDSSEEERRKKKKKKAAKKRRRSSDSDSSDSDAKRKKKKKKAAKPIEFQPKGQLLGLCSYGATQEHFPMIVLINTVVPEAPAAPAPGAEQAGNQLLEGTVKWSTLNNAETKFRGKMSADGTFEIEEYEVITGVDDVVVPTKYKGSVVTGNAISGAVEGQDQATFKLDYLAPPPAPAAPAPAAPPPPPPPPPLPKEFEVIKDGAELKGTVTLQVPMNIHFDKVAGAGGGEVTATVTWPSLAGAVSHVRGTISVDGQLSFDELDIDKSILRSFKGKLEVAENAVKGPVTAKDAAADSRSPRK
jgi:hypothetical protein